MTARTAMLHVRVDEDTKTRAAEALAGSGLTLSDAVRVLLARVAQAGGLPPELAASGEAYDAWFRAKVQEALDDTSPTIPHDEVMDEIDALIEEKARERG